MHVKMPMNRFSHHYTHNIPLKEEFNETYKNMGICDGLCYPKYQFRALRILNADFKHKK